VHRVNEFVLKRISHRLNTFPSGHVAVSLAAALEVMSISQPAGIVLLSIASAIAAGAVLGRYHYALDVVVGAVLGMTVSWFV
jgi:membrane-associated phospholipid phosphatase